MNTLRVNGHEFQVHTHVIKHATSAEVQALQHALEDRLVVYVDDQPAYLTHLGEVTPDIGRDTYHVYQVQWKLR